MATIVNGTPVAPASDITSPTGAMPGGVKQSAKGAPNAGGKNSDAGRKQSGNVSDGVQRYELISWDSSSYMQLFRSQNDST